MQPGSERIADIGASHAYKWAVCLALLLGLLWMPKPAEAKALTQTINVAQACYAVADEAPGSAVDTLVRFDRTNGQTFPIGSIGTEDIEGILFNSDGELLAANANRLGTLDLNTAVFTPKPLTFGIGRGSEGNINLWDVDSMGYDIEHDRYYGVHRRNPPKADLLFVFDAQTGAHVPDAFGPGIDYLPVEILVDPVDNTRLLDDVDDIAIDPVTGDMYAAINDSGAGGVLGKINPETGAVTAVGTFHYPAVNPANPALASTVIDDMEGLAFLNDGQLYGSTGDNGPDQEDLNKFFQIDKETGEGIELGPFPVGLQDYEGVDCLPFQAYIVMQKLTNGPGQKPQDADTIPGPSIDEGEQVVWTYVITNTAVFTLTDLVLTDDQLGPVGPGGAADCPAAGTILPPGESITCTVTGIAEIGQYANTAVVTGTTEVGLITPRMTVTSTDLSHYFGLPLSQLTPKVDIEKATNGEDADEATGPLVGVGSTVTWTYVVENTGNVTLVNLVVTDDQIGDICTIPSLAPGESTSCEMTGIAQEGQYANVGTVTATPQEGPSEPVTDSDASHYLGMPIGPTPLVDIEKATNGEDADEAPGPRVEIGSTVTWAYVVKNTGNVTLVNLVVTDDQIGNICTIPSLAPGESTSCEMTGIAQQGQYVNTGTVTGTPQEGPGGPVTDSDLSHYLGAPNEPPNEFAVLGDFVWFDDNKDGIQDAGEEGIAEIIVRLFQDNFDGEPVQALSTDATGHYTFTELEPGTYCLEFVVPDALDPAPANAGADDAVDSDGVTWIDETVIRTACFDLVEGQIDLTRDLGLVEDTTPTGEKPTEQPHADREYLYLPNLTNQ